VCYFLQMKLVTYRTQALSWSKNNENITFLFLFVESNLFNRSILHKVDMAANDADHAHSCRDWNPNGKCHVLLHEGVYLHKMALCASFTYLEFLRG